MHLIASLPPGMSDMAIEQTARQHGAVTRALSRTYLTARHRAGLILGFTGSSPHALTRAATSLAQIVQQQRGR
jgi:DNA-binding transcriptional MocR family regulator